VVQIDLHQEVADGAYYVGALYEQLSVAYQLRLKTLYLYDLSAHRRLIDACPDQPLYECMDQRLLLAIEAQDYHNSSHYPRLQNRQSHCLNLQPKYLIDHAIRLGI
jgi:hypothetical protein